MGNWTSSNPCKNCGKKYGYMVKCTNCGTLGCPSCVGNPGKKHIVKFVKNLLKL